MGCCYNISKNDSILLLNRLTTAKGTSSVTNQTSVTLIEKEAPKKAVNYETHEIHQKVDIPLTISLFEGPKSEINSELIKNGKKLILKIIESEHIPKGLTLVINPGGLEGSERNVKDGITYFGKRSSEFSNDFNFPDEEIVSDNHFFIKYDPPKNTYMIKNIKGIGTFIKIQNKVILKSNSIFSFGTTHILVKIPVDATTFKENTSSYNSKINFKVIYGIKNDCNFEFESSSTSNIRFGRLDNGKTELVFPDESISRLQCSVFYQYPNWYIVDSDGINQSTNGTWLLADEYNEIFNGMIFRAGLTTFESILS